MPLQASKSRIFTRPKAVAHGMLRNELISRIMVAIMKGDLAGGQWLGEQELAKRFGVSRTPIREAVNHLASFGIVRLYPNRGAQAQPFGSTQLRDIYLIRQILESEATRLACGRVAAKDIDWLHEQTRMLLDQREDSREWARQQMKFDRYLHDMIAKSCGSERLQDEIERYWVLIDAVRTSLGHRYEMREQALREHLRILEALREGDADTAVTAMAEHINHTADAAVTLMFGSTSA